MTDAQRFRQLALDAIDAGQVAKAEMAARSAAKARHAELAATAPSCAYCGEPIVGGVGGFDRQIKICESCTSLGD